jgi:hypothetical protein
MDLARAEARASWGAQHAAALQNHRVAKRDGLKVHAYAYFKPMAKRKKRRQAAALQQERRPGDTGTPRLKLLNVSEI